ncbi:MAG TPA: sensor histidine kinase, partial [Thiolinea sp.]|nr:sensor histidine kinase [Thiolinea sp.]
QMLILARQEATLEPATRQLSSINALVSHAVQTQQGLAVQQQIHLEAELSFDEPQLAVNASSLEILLRNLIENALKHTPAGGSVRIAVQNEAEAVVLRISDNGCGIDPVERERVFGRFYRAANNQHSGTGLGLAIVKSIAEQHHASIQLADNLLEGQGLVVVVRIPKYINKI